MMSIEEALLLSVEAHRGKVDLDGKPYVLHPLKVGLSGDNRDEMVAGFLHDVPEDTGYSVGDLLEMEIGSEVGEALKLLTHDKRTRYDEYLNRLMESGNELALKVKKRDLQDNLSRNDRKTPVKMRIYEKHEAALEKLNNLKIKLLAEK